MPFEPVYVDSATGAWSAPDYNYLEKRAPWQAYLDKKLKKKDYMDDTGVQPQQHKTSAAAAAAASTPSSTTPTTDQSVPSSEHS